jgi:DnaD/phage-associated family protein
MEYKINLSGRCESFTVPSAVTDNYLKTADADALKVLLYLLRCGGNFEEVSVTDEKITKATKVKDVKSALEFWCDANVLEITDDGNIVCGEVYSQSEIQKRAEIKKITALQHDFTPSPKDLADAVSKNKAIEKIYSKYVEIKGADLTYTDKKFTAAIVDTGLPYDVIMMFLEYCKSAGITRPRNMQKIAQDWLENGIDTVLKAEEEINYRVQFNEKENLVMQILEIHELSDNQKKYMKKWLDEYCFDHNIIYNAKQIALDNGVKKNLFNYMDKVLENWYKKNLRSKEEIQNYNKKNSGNYKTGNDSKPSYDLDRRMKKIREKYRSP